MARPRNNITRLDLGTRTRICQLLADGEQYDDVRQDAEVAAACAAAGLQLHNKSFRAFMEGHEYAEYLRMRREFATELERRRLAAFFVESEGGSDAIAKAAKSDAVGAARTART